jgi:hypothetical protein
MACRIANQVRLFMAQGKRRKTFITVLRRPIFYWTVIFAIVGWLLSSKSPFIDLEQVYSHVCIGAVMGLVVGFIFEDNNKRKKSQYRR